MAQQKTFQPWQREWLFMTWCERVYYYDSWVYVFPSFFQSPHVARLQTYAHRTHPHRAHNFCEASERKMRMKINKVTLVKAFTRKRTNVSEKHNMIHTHTPRLPFAVRFLVIFNFLHFICMDVFKSRRTNVKFMPSMESHFLQLICAISPFSCSWIILDLILLLFASHLCFHWSCHCFFSPSNPLNLTCKLSGHKRNDFSVNKFFFCIRYLFLRSHSLWMRFRWVCGFSVKCL